jgi:hypothetical protein
MKLKSFGCSFIFGSDLADDSAGVGEPFFPPSQLTWPALLSKYWEYDYECHARPGSGNLRILERVLSQATIEPAFFVIGWSWIDRFDYLTKTNRAPINQRHPYDLANQENIWKTVLPTSDDSITKFYYKNLHSQYQDKLSTLIHMRTAVDVLNQRQIPFIMTYMDELTFEQQYHINPAVTDLQNYLRAYMTKFEGQTFLEYSQQRGFAISPRLHPLEQAHQAAFELLKDYSF